MPLTVILRSTRNGQRHELARGATGQVEWREMKAAEAEASRMRFRDDHHDYCVLSGIFETLQEAQSYVYARNKGESIERAMKRIRAARLSRA